MFLLCAAGIAGCGESNECNIDAASRRVAGPGVIDCGIASVDDTTDVVDGCSVETYNARGTFRAIYEQDDGTLEAVIHAAGDTFHLLRMRAGSEQIEQSDCEGAHVVSTDGRTYVQCDGPGRFRVLCP